MTTLSADVLDAYIMGVALRLLRESGTCTSAALQERAAKECSDVTPKRCTTVLKRLVADYGFLGLSEDPKNDRMVRLEPATTWFEKSRMFGRLYSQFPAKEKVARLISKEVASSLKEHPSPVAYFDAGSTTLHGARQCGKLMSQWTILTNNLLLASELIHGDPKPRCYLASGEADLATAAIVESNAEEFERWLTKNKVKVSVVSFHWLLTNDDEDLIFVAELANEEQSKVLAVKCAKEKVVIPLTTDKFDPAGDQKRKLLKYSNGVWTSLVAGGEETQLNLPEVVLCLDKKISDHEESYQKALLKMDKDENVRVRS